LVGDWLKATGKVVLTGKREGISTTRLLTTLNSALVPAGQPQPTSLTE
jgi:hypothetical protein